MEKLDFLATLSLILHVSILHAAQALVHTLIMRRHAFNNE